MGEFAFRFFEWCKNKKHKIIYSELVNLELKNLEDLIKERLQEYKEVICKVNTTEEELGEANKTSKERKLSFNDILHAIIARDNKATIITRDFHFQELFDIVDSKKPEEAISD